MHEAAMPMGRSQAFPGDLTFHFSLNLAASSITSSILLQDHLLPRLIGVPRIKAASPTYLSLKVQQPGKEEEKEKKHQVPPVPHMPPRVTGTPTCELAQSQRPRNTVSRFSSKSNALSKVSCDPQKSPLSSLGSFTYKI